MNSRGFLPVAVVLLYAVHLLTGHELTNGQDPEHVAS
jgi:hypothetical protein